MDEPDQDGPYVLADYPQGVAKITVGIVPLLESKFNDAKSYLKGMEYAACGVPFVASPTPEYRLLNNEGLGLLATDKSKSWKRHVKRVLETPAMQQEMGGYGREVIARYHTYEGNAWRWAEAWEEARRRSRIAFALGT
jgi:glycosyltransferase involved in cell wall biosynthesis